MGLRDMYGTPTAGAQTAGVAPASPTFNTTQAAPSLSAPTASAPTPTAQPTSTPQTQATQSVMPNLNQSVNNYNSGGYTGFGNSVLTPQAAGQSNMSGGDGSTPGQIPGAVPQGLYTNQATQLSSNYGPNVHGGAMSFINNFNANHPLMNLSVDNFNQAAATNVDAAFQMLQQGGQQFRNAVMAKNGWDQNQMNQWLNQVYAERAGQAFSPQAGAASTFAQFGAQQAQPTHFGPQGYAQGFTGPAVRDPGLGYTNYTLSPTYTGGPRVPNPVAAAMAAPNKNIRPVAPLLRASHPIIAPNTRPTTVIPAAPLLVNR